MAYYVMMDPPNEKARNPRTLGELLTVENYLGDPVLPLFTDYVSLRSFARVYYAREGRVEPTPLWMYPFQMAQMVEPMKEAGRLEYVVFNPLSASAGKWRSRRGPVSVRKFCRFIREIRPEIKNLGKELVDTGVHGPEDIKGSLQRLRPQIEKLAQDAGARTEEWEVEDES
jgi:hypothetical protein